MPHPHIHKRDVMMTLDDCDKKMLNSAVKYLKKYNGPRNTLLDLGAHIGGTALYFAAELEFKHVFAIEAYWENFRWLVNNIYNNDLGDRITPLWAAVALHTGEFRPIYWTENKTNHGQHSMFFRDDVHPQTDFTQTISFEHILGLFDSIDVLKVDIEGSEYEIFSPRESLKNALSKQVRFLDLETHCPESNYFEQDRFIEYGYQDTRTANGILYVFLQECGFEFDPEGVSMGRFQGSNRNFG